MGCDFNLLIQVRYGDVWVNIVNFGTKTGCGGYPLCAAPVALAKEMGTRGTYHADEAEVLMVDEVLMAMGLEAKNEGKHVESRLAMYKIEYPGEGVPHYLYYSTEEFRDLIKRIPLLEHEGDQYTRLMDPIPKWMEMATTAYPEFKEVWMHEAPEHIERMTKSLCDRQTLLSETYKELLVKTLHGKIDLSEDLIRYIAGFASPRGSDVRLAWNDDEDHCHDISEYN